MKTISSRQLCVFSNSKATIKSTIERFLMVQKPLFFMPKTQKMNISNIYKQNQTIIFSSIDKNQLIVWVEDLYHILFGIGYQNQTFEELQIRFDKSKSDFEELLHSFLNDKLKSGEIASNLYHQIDKIHAWLVDDLEAIFAFDPAAKNNAEIILSYLGFYAIAIYQVSQQLWKQNIPVIPIIISEHVHNKTGIDIHPGAQIGEKFFIDHGTRIVIGETRGIWR